MENNISLDDLNYVKSGNSLSDEEMDKIDGTRIHIDNVIVEPGTSTYGKDGKPLPEGQERDVQKLKLTSKEFGEDLIGRNHKHVERYNLKDQSDGTWIVSLHEKSKTAQFLAKYKIDNFKNVNAIENGVVLVKKTVINSRGERRSFMTISI